MKIYIPTYMREDRQKCYNNLPPKIQKMVTLVTHSGRFDILKEHQPNADIVDLGKTDGIADVRQKLMIASKTDKLLIIDDSCTFKKRNKELRLIDMTEDDYLEMFSKVDQLLDEYPMVGISDQAGNNRVPESVKEIGRSYSCYGVNRKVWIENGISFDGMYQKDNEIKLYEDFYAILNLLTKGHKNAIIYDYAFSHAHGKSGGNSTIRTNSLQKKCIEALQETYPGLVKLVRKENPSWKAGLTDEDEFRWECQISWQDAYKRGSTSSSLESLFI